MIRKLFLASGIAAAVTLAACSQKSGKMNDDLRKDLDVASGSNGLELANGNGASQQVVSAIEQSPQAPKRVASSQRTVRNRHVEKAPPAPVETETSAISEQTVQQSVEPAPVATQPDIQVAPRPSPVIVQMPSGGNGRIGAGPGGGISIGDMIGVVLRGGGVDGDHCEPPGARRGRPTIDINNRIPIIRGTYPRR